MSMMFPDTLYFADAGIRNGVWWVRLTRPFRYISSQGIITVPAGFETDGASIPRAFWSIIGPHGPYFRAAVIHDFLYAKASDESFKVSRKIADCLFKEAMFNGGVNWFTREKIYQAVRMFGWRSFKKR
jgi:hypothetical protein